MWIRNDRWPDTINWMQYRNWCPPLQIILEGNIKAIGDRFFETLSRTRLALSIPNMLESQNIIQINAAWRHWLFWSMGCWSLILKSILTAHLASPLYRRCNWWTILATYVKSFRVVPNWNNWAQSVTWVCRRWIWNAWYGDILRWWMIGLSRKNLDT